MRILEIVPTWPAETFIMRHISALQSVPLDLAIGVARPEDPTWASIGKTVDATLIPLTFGNMFARAKAAVPILLGERNPKLTIRENAVLRIIDNYAPDLVHFHFGWLAVQMYNLLGELSVPYTVSLRGSDIQIFPVTNDFSIGDSYSNVLQEVLETAAAVHTVCDEFGKKSKDIYKSTVRTETIRTVVPIPKNIQNIKSINNKLITVGRLQWVKGFHDLIRAMSYTPNMSLDIVGEGDERGHLQFLIHSLNLQDRVHLLGKLSFEELQVLVQQSTAFVQSSLSEGFSNSLAEAMALGKPVFATEAGGTGELITHKENGIIIPIGDPEGMAEQFKKIYDIDLMQRLGIAARETAIREFAPEVHAQNFLAFYRKVYESLR